MGVGRILIAALLALAASVTAEAQQPMRIQFAEAVNVPAGTGSISFDAYGRRFDLELADNDRLTSKLSGPRKAQISAVKILRGKLTGQAHSWVRLTEYDGRIEGAIWDGKDLYVVTTHDRIAANLTTPLAAPPGQTVVYRLSDTIDLFPAGFCPDLPSPGLPANNGLAQYRSLVADLASKAEAQSLPLYQIEISLIGDANFQALFIANPTAELLARHNVADGIFTDQVGVVILPTDLRLAPTSPDPFTSTDADTLLDQLSNFRRDTPEVRAQGLAHLLTGHTLDGTTIGIAYRGALCEVTTGVGLTESSFSVTRDGLVMAHEFGHNFGSPHDGADACASSPPGYIMAPQFNNSGQFSSCSLGIMQTNVQAALGRCIGPANYPDVELPAPSPQIEVELDTPLTVPFVVNSTGTQTARNVQLRINAPFSIDVASLPPSCSITANTAFCALGDMAPGDTRTVSLTVLPTSLGYTSFSATVSADVNPNRRNDTQQQPILVRFNADATIAIRASATDVLIGDPVDFFVDVSSIRTHAVQDARVTFSPGLTRVASASVTAGICDVQPSEVRCSLGDIPAGVTRTITIHTTASQAGETFSAASVNVTREENPNNDLATINLRVRAVHDVGVDLATPDGIWRTGQPFEFRANLHSYGTQGIDNVAAEILWTFPPNAQASVDSVMVGGVPCVIGAVANQCVVGSMAAGEIVPVVISGHADSVGTYYFQVRAISPDDQDTSNDSVGRGYGVQHTVDVEVFDSYSSGIETEESSGSLLLTSWGANVAGTSDVMVTAPPEVRFTNFAATPNLASCNIVDEHHLHCSMQMGAAGSGLTGATYFMVSDVPGTYVLTAHVTTPNDEEPANDTADLTFVVNPILDVGVQPFQLPSTLRVGTEFSVQTTIFSGMRPVPSANALIQTNAGAELTSVTVGAGTCTRYSPSLFQCDLGSLPGNASIPVTVVVRAVAQNGTSNLRIAASASSDHDYSNGDRTVWFATEDPGDMGVRVATATASATAGTAFALPRISLTRTGAWSSGRLEVSLPAGMTVNSMSTAIPTCSGTSLLQCDLPAWNVGTDLTLDLNVTAATAGNFTVNAKVIASNDTDATNNEANVAVSVIAAAPPPQSPPPSNPKGGGGGRFEWLALAVLALLVARRIPLRRVHTRH